MFNDEMNRMRLELNKINPTYYNSKKLDSMTQNDMAYALSLSKQNQGR